MKIVNVAEMRRIEEAANAGGHSYAAMMELAGSAVAHMADTLMLPDPEQRVLILIGPGNNGGDGLVAASTLLELGHTISLYIWTRESRGDELLRKLKRRRRGITILWADNDPDWEKLRGAARDADLIVDALLGTGTSRPLEGKLIGLLAVVREEVNARRLAALEEPLPPAEMPRFPLLEAMSLGLPPPPQPPEPDFDDELDELGEDWDELDTEDDEDGLEDEDEEWDEEWEPDDEEEYTPPMLPWPQPPILAVDCPSGLNCDTGELDPAALRADLTITFAFPKWGHVQYPGAAACGLLAVTPIGLPADAADAIHADLADPELIRRWLPARPPDAHKGTFGKVMIAAGSISYTGAAFLSGQTATLAGAGLVTLAIPAPLHPILAGVLPEVTWLALPDAEGAHTRAGVARLLARLNSYDAFLVGPGLTTEPAAAAFIEALFAADGLPAAAWRSRVVVDADALNILAGLSDWPSRLPPGSILTPHPGELARLTGQTSAEINAARIATAQRCATTWGHTVLLKGAHTVIAGPEGQIAVLPFALPTLATAGSGDVLAGAIVALLAQGVPAFEAAVCGAYLHGQAGLLISRDISVVGTARNIAERLPEALRLLYGVTR